MQHPIALGEGETLSLVFWDPAEAGPRVLHIGGEDLPRIAALLASSAPSCPPCPPKEEGGEETFEDLLAHINH